MLIYFINYISQSQDCPGITFLTMQEIYKKMETLEDKSCEIGISYLEVYNETVKDLLKPGGIYLDRFFDVLV